VAVLLRLVSCDIWHTAAVHRRKSANLAQHHNSGIPRILEWEGRGAAGDEEGGEWGGDIFIPTGGKVWVGVCATFPENFSYFFVENTIF